MARPVGGTEIPIDSQIARRAILERFPALGPARVEPFAEGWDFSVFRVDGDTLFRFPKRRDCIEGLRRELSILRTLGPAQPLAVPDYRWTAPGAEAFPAPFGGYPMLPGTIAARVPAHRVDQDAVLDQVAELLAVLRATPRSVVREAGIDRDPDDDWIVAPEPGEHGTAHRIEQIADELPARALRATRDYLATMTGPPLPPAAEVLIHDDLTAVHTLVDEGTGRLCGIIDWADVHLGHPIADLVGWYGWLGRAFVERLLERTSADDPPRWLAWIRDRVVLLGISEIFHARQTGDANARAMGRQMLARALDLDPW